MAGTYSQLLLHIVFSTKGRTPWIVPDVAERLYPVMGGIVRAEKGVLYAIGGVEGPVHMYVRWRPDGTVSDLIRTVKSRSSKWVHETYPTLAAFSWQGGYSVFSVSKSQDVAVKAYIAKQAEHHSQEDFKSEHLQLLPAHERHVRREVCVRLRAPAPTFPLALRGRTSDDHAHGFRCEAGQETFRLKKIHPAADRWAVLNELEARAQA
jgi:putative transposase